MRKNVLKMSAIAMAILISLGASVSATAAVTKGKTAKAATNITMTTKGGRTAPTAEEQALMKATQTANAKKVLDYLVSKGEITQADADTAYKLFSDTTGPIDFSKMPEAVQTAWKALQETMKNLTEAQRTALRTAEKEYMKAELQKLVDAGTITADQMNEMVSDHKGIKGENSETKMTSVQMEAIHNASEAARAAAIQKLQTDGTFTTEQATKLSLPLMERGMGRGMEMERPQMTETEKATMKTEQDARFKAFLNYYVSAGSITQADADTAYKLMQSSNGPIDFSKLPASVEAAMKDLRNTRDSLTDAQRSAIEKAMEQSLKANTQKAPDVNASAEEKAALKAAREKAEKAVLESLKADGTISAEQAAKLSLEGFGFMGHGGPGGPGEHGDHHGAGMPNGEIPDAGTNTGADEDVN